jgi:putative hydrolase of the HAD superfamily
MTKNKYKAIFCDLGNVLINFDHAIAVKKILRLTPKSELEIYELFFDSSLTKDYEEGRINTLDFYKGVKDMLQLDMSYEAFLPVWDDIFFETPRNVRMHDFIRFMRNKYKLAMVSNINEAHYKFLKNKMAVFNDFDSVILSYEVGARKPDPGIYDAAMRSVNASPAEVFYIDDRADLIEAASRLGIKGMIFDGEESFKKIKEELS